jgi:hypothetical protein
MKKLFVSVGSFAFALLLSCSDENPNIHSTEDVGFLLEEAYPGATGNTILKAINGVDYELTQINDNYLLESDIIVAESQLSENAGGRAQGVGLLNRRWPGGTVYYTISSSLTNQVRVTNAIAHWEANTPIRFVRRTTQANYINFRTGSGCSSNIGMIGGVQYINLATGCSTGNTIHEIGHAIGLFHEHSALARDTYVIVNWSNILAGYENNFNKATNASDYSSFDFGSIMMYPSSAFSSNGLPTLVRLDGTTWTAQRTGLSTNDKLAVDVMY